MQFFLEPPLHTVPQTPLNVATRVFYYRRGGAKFQPAVLRQRAQQPSPLPTSFVPGDSRTISWGMTMGLCFFTLGGGRLGLSEKSDFHRNAFPLVLLFQKMHFVFRIQKDSFRKDSFARRLRDSPQEFYKRG